METSRRGFLRMFGAAALVLCQPAVIRTPGLLMPISPMRLKLTLPCNGAPVSIADYPELFKLLGYDYGAGLTRDTFRLPALVDTSIYTGVHGDADRIGLLASKGGVILAQPIIQRYWRDTPRSQALSQHALSYEPAPLAAELAWDYEQEVGEAAYAAWADAMLAAEELENFPPEGGLNALREARRPI
jgi:microcystin-dependent protein